MILLVDHGSHSEAANQVLEDLAEIVKQLTSLPVCVAHMQWAEPSIEAAVRACANEGAGEITVVPVFLVPGKHCMTDIPRMVEDAAGEIPGLKCRVTPPLGAHRKIAEVIAERIADAVDGRHEPDPS